MPPPIPTVCVDCSNTFTRRDPDSRTEVRCGDCQTAFRIRGSDKPQSQSWPEYLAARRSRASAIAEKYLREIGLIPERKSP